MKLIDITPEYVDGMALKLAGAGGMRCLPR
jgi:hypothetical protein